MDLVDLGTIINTKGIDGKMVVVNAPRGVFLPSESSVFVGYSKNFTENFSLLEDFIGEIGRSNLLLKEITTKEDASQLKEKGLFADKKEVLKYNENYIFRDEILDCDVFDIDKNCNIGKVVDIWEMPANNVWVVKIDGVGELPLPVIDDVIKECDLENKIIKIKMLAGLEELIT